MAESGAVTVRVRWRTALHEVSLPPSASLSELAQLLADATGIAPDTARVVVSGKMLALSDDGRSVAEAGLASVGRPPLLLLGQTAAETEAVVTQTSAAQAAALRLREPSAEHEERVARQRAAGAPQKEPSPPRGEYTFGAFTTLQGPLLPSSRHALLLLYKVASDPGIVAVMTSHRWKVGVLSEMPPEGKVGVSAMCVLGYNVNQGQEIALRLRTDDMRGFRRFERIRETLVHELAHMVYGEHDLRFKALNSQLTREAAAANPDWSRPAVGRTLGGDAHASWAASEDIRPSQHRAVAGHVLGGASAGPLSPRTAAAEAAARREAEMAAEARDALGAAAQDPSGCGAGSDGDSGGTEVGEARA
jgi:hypothetical protein